MNFNLLNNRKGFTLIEILIALAIMIAIVFATSRALRQTFEYRDLLQRQGEFYNTIRLAIGILERDFSLLYSPTILLDKKVIKNYDPGNPKTNPILDPQTGAAIITPSGVDLSRSSDFWGPALDANGLRPSRFVGTASKLSFITSSHARVYRDRPESQFAKVKYELMADTGEEAISGTTVLIRKENTNAFDLEDRETKDQLALMTTYPVLRGIREFKMKFYRRDQDRWVDTWDSVDSVEQRNHYPDVIELTLEVKGPLELNFLATYYLKKEIPLNGLDPSF